MNNLINEYPKKSISKRRAIFRKRTEKDITLLLEGVAPKVSTKKLNLQKARPLAKRLSRHIEQVLISKEQDFFSSAPEHPLSDKQIISRALNEL